MDESGRAYFEPLLNYDVYTDIAAYDKDVLLIHGDADSIVPLSYSERALKSYASARLEVLPGSWSWLFRRGCQSGHPLDAGIFEYSYSF